MHNPRMIANTGLALICALLVQTKSFAEPMNIVEAKQSLRTYHDSGLYDKEIQTIANQANQYILQEAKLNQQRKHPLKLAIVLDVDETSLSYYEAIEKRDFCYNASKARETILNQKAPAIQPILKLYNEALKHDISVFFVTARHDDTYDATARNLQKAGYQHWAAIYTRPNHLKDGKHSRAPFKTDIRAKITQKGYTIIASIGDQNSDLSGGYAKKTFKLPNPFYYIP